MIEQESAATNHPDIFNDYTVSDSKVPAVADDDTYDAARSILVEYTWMGRAACNDRLGSNADLFFSENLNDIAAAKRICHDTCPVIDQCLQFALDHREPLGVWGGELFRHGEPIEKNKMGRPPKPGI